MKSKVIIVAFFLLLASFIFSLKADASPSVIPYGNCTAYNDIVRLISVTGPTVHICRPEIIPLNKFANYYYLVQWSNNRVWLHGSSNGKLWAECFHVLFRNPAVWQILGEHPTNIQVSGNTAYC